MPCLARKTLPLCRHYTYPELSGHPLSDDPELPGGGGATVYTVDDADLLEELQTPRLATVAQWQPKVNVNKYTGDS